MLKIINVFNSLQIFIYKCILFTVKLKAWISFCIIPHIYCIQNRKYCTWLHNAKNYNLTGHTQSDLFIKHGVSSNKQKRPTQNYKKSYNFSSCLNSLVQWTTTWVKGLEHLTFVKGLLDYWLLLSRTDSEPHIHSVTNPRGFI